MTAKSGNPYQVRPGVFAMMSAEPQPKTDPTPPDKRPASPTRVEANRRNAAKSTGPRTLEGKMRASMNNLTHGMCSEARILPGEDPEALQHRLDVWADELDARTEAERLLVEKAVHAAWR